MPQLGLNMQLIIVWHVQDTGFGMWHWEKYTKNNL